MHLLPIAPGKFLQLAVSPALASSSSKSTILSCHYIFTGTHQWQGPIIFDHAAASNTIPINFTIYTTSASCSRCVCGMQQPNTGSTRARSALWWCPCASCIWLLHPAHTPAATCAGGLFSWFTSAFTNVHISAGGVFPSTN